MGNAPKGGRPDDSHISGRPPLSTPPQIAESPSFQQSPSGHIAGKEDEIRESVPRAHSQMPSSQFSQYSFQSQVPTDARQGQMPEFSMKSMRDALPGERPYDQTYGPRRDLSSSSPTAYRVSHNPQFPMQPVHQFNPSFPPQYQQNHYGAQQSSYQPNSPNTGSYYRGSGPPYMLPQHPQYYYAQTPASSQNSFFLPTQYAPNYPPQTLPGDGGPADASTGRGSQRPVVVGGAPTNLSSTPRGPPRKPKQSGHALWVGNLPPGANVIDLKDHFSREATDDILSVFLISKSNCAFVNYKSDESCAAAMSRFHDSRFQGVRLVCRLRRNSVNTNEASKSSGDQQAIPTTPLPPADPISLLPPASDVDLQTKSAKERFFVVKSLTVEDLELSVRNRSWATQSHNETALNQAYQTTESIFLIFSANKSGEYFGYARMISPINDDPEAAIEFAPKAQDVEETDLPKATPTEATEFAPPGRIIDDSARGTIFWEAEAEVSEGLVESEDAAVEASDQEDHSTPAKAWGKPFKIDWKSTRRLPFYRTRGIRNPWNANREVKIARDGTELETSVGQRLVQMFHREPSPPPQMSQQAMGGYAGMQSY